MSRQFQPQFGTGYGSGISSGPVGGPLELCQTVGQRASTGFWALQWPLVILGHKDRGRRWLWVGWVGTVGVLVVHGSWEGDYLWFWVVLWPPVEQRCTAGVVGWDMLP